MPYLSRVNSSLEPRVVRSSGTHHPSMSASIEGCLLPAQERRSLRPAQRRSRLLRADVGYSAEL